MREMMAGLGEIRSKALDLPGFSRPQGPPPFVNSLPEVGLYFWHLEFSRKSVPTGGDAVLTDQAILNGQPRQHRMGSLTVAGSPCSLRKRKQAQAIRYRYQGR